MLVAVLGATGMLGKRVNDECLKAGYTTYTPRGDFLYYDPDKLRECSALINCIGIVPQRSLDRARTVEANSYAPHWLAKLVVPMINVSTDCIFSGNLDMGRQYSPGHLTDAVTDYGRSKILGESHETYVCNVRTSFIGLEHGLMKWLIDQPENAVISGWYNTAWSGSTVELVAQALVQMVPGIVQGGYNNIEHLATLKAMTKYDLLVHLAKKYNPTVKVSCDQIAVPINRALVPTIELQSCLV